MDNFPHDSRSVASRVLMRAHKGPLNQSSLGRLLNQKITTTNQVRCRAPVNIYASAPQSENRNSDLTHISSGDCSTTVIVYARILLPITAVQLFICFLTDLDDLYEIALSLQCDFICCYEKKYKDDKVSVQFI